MQHIIKHSTSLLIKHKCHLHEQGDEIQSTPSLNYEINLQDTILSIKIGIPNNKNTSELDRPLEHPQNSILNPTIVLATTYVFTIIISLHKNEQVLDLVYSALF